MISAVFLHSESCLQLPKVLRYQADKTILSVLSVWSKRLQVSPKQLGFILPLQLCDLWKSINIHLLVYYIQRFFSQLLSQSTQGLILCCCLGDKLFCLDTIKNPCQICFHFFPTPLFFITTRYQICFGIRFGVL